jgi:hypothetical protein
MFPNKKGECMMKELKVNSYEDPILSKTKKYCIDLGVTINQLAIEMGYNQGSDIYSSIKRTYHPEVMIERLKKIGIDITEEDIDRHHKMIAEKTGRTEHKRFRGRKPGSKTGSKNRLNKSKVKPFLKSELIATELSSAPEEYPDIILGADPNKVDPSAKVRVVRKPAYYYHDSQQVNNKPSIDKIKSVTYKLLGRFYNGSDNRESVGIGLHDFCINDMAWNTKEQYEELKIIVDYAMIELEKMEKIDCKIETTITLKKRNENIKLMHHVENVPNKTSTFNTPPKKESPETCQDCNRIKEEGCFIPNDGDGESGPMPGCLNYEHQTSAYCKTCINAGNLMCYVQLADDDKRCRDYKSI